MTLTNCLATCSFYSMKNVVRYIETGVKLSFLLANPNTTIVLCHGWKREKIGQC